MKMIFQFNMLVEMFINDPNEAIEPTLAVFALSMYSSPPKNKQMTLAKSGT